MRWPILLGACALLCNHAAAQQKEETDNRLLGGNGTEPAPALGIGRFPFFMNDSRLQTGVDQAKSNWSTYLPHHDLLLKKVEEYYTSYSFNSTPDATTQIQELGSIFNQSMGEGFEDVSQLGLNLLTQAYNSANYWFEWDNSTLGVPNEDIAWYYVNILYQLPWQTYWYIQGAFFGVGRESACAAEISNVIASKEEWEKTGSAAATTLMAIAPVFLAFGNLYIPRSSEVYSTSALVGFTTSFYSFGLPTKSISAVKGTNSLSLALFGIAAITLFSSYGRTCKYGFPTENPPLEELRRWSRGRGDKGYHKTRARGARPEDDENDMTRLAIQRIISSIKNNVADWTNRWHMWQLPALIISAVHVLMFYFAIWELFSGVGVPKFLLSCNKKKEIVEWTGYYLLASSGVNAVIRFFNWEKSSHERIKAYSLSKPSLDALNEIIDRTQDDARTTETEMPPLLPPVILRSRLFAISIWRKVTKCFNRKNRRRSEHFNNHQYQSIGVFQKFRLRFIFTWKNLWVVVRAGFRPSRQKHIQRWRPIYILLHLATSARNPILTLVTGFIEALLLLALTFFFAAQWGGNLFITVVALALLLLFTTIGRALGLIYVWMSSELWGLTVINCESKEEIRGMLRILCSMEDVLVIVNGATYFGGYRMDGREGFKAFLEKYEAGDYDEEPRWRSTDAAYDSGTNDASSPSQIPPVSTSPLISPFASPGVAPPYSSIPRRNSVDTKDEAITVVRKRSHDYDPSTDGKTSVSHVENTQSGPQQSETSPEGRQQRLVSISSPPPVGDSTENDNEKDAGRIV